MIIREITDADFGGLMRLYAQLGPNNPVPEKDGNALAVWQSILADKNHYIIVAEEDGKVVSSCVCVIIPNMTHVQRPYAIVENVVTDSEYRCRGYATACLDRAREIAESENCYKIMLATGSKRESTIRFYERAGYDRTQKTAFIQRLPNKGEF